MWFENLDDEEYERLTLDYDYPEYSNSYNENKQYLTRDKHTERYIDSYYDAVNSDSFSD